MSKTATSTTKKSAAHTPEPRPSSRKSKGGVIVAATIIAVLLFVVALNVFGGAPAKENGSAEGPTQQDYIGRLLPAGYEAPSVAKPTLYTAAYPMTEIAAAKDELTLAVSLPEILASKITRFDYTRGDGQVLPIIAYVKPMGDLFVAVSYCPPCEGEGQRIEADGTLTCEACGTRRNLESNEGLSGACRLYPLDEIPSSVTGDVVSIDTGVLETWTSQPLDRPIG